MRSPHNLLFWLNSPSFHRGDVLLLSHLLHTLTSGGHEAAVCTLGFLSSSLLGLLRCSEQIREAVTRCECIWKELEAQRHCRLQPWMGCCGTMGAVPSFVLAQHSWPAACWGRGSAWLSNSLLWPHWERLSWLWEQLLLQQVWRGPGGVHPAELLCSYWGIAAVSLDWQTRQRQIRNSNMALQKPFILTLQNPNACWGMC